ncbi:hypothetical protein HMPREF9171_1872 [Streptococcus agalactiae ATCC 13813]|jgi:hypothetical protein|uniref:Uncharacterized protein n=2 Tax=Streptococcus TaxID=1301 RepID=A0A2G3NVG6_STRMC|nr:hypothetical protein [Streptococcus agalactiae]EFV96643.1 hypothetical protein HMPREF9171_1872 [Streptococcus agalactiae ATCC 13813]KIS16343.1 hypothetical protein AT55_01156 [Streptococcus equi subsp. zooepidemicus Sz4is]MCO4471210.1 hypothetical protein [Streptococcus infantarius subsp. infantarius]NAZ67601.1 hypothetical protein [Streptococcus pyogenes]NRG66116.1 hypothetical protein [Streptococcus suis]PHV57557.1 hypothetical protein CS010_04290 [Streptococcus macedonicus]QGX01509.1 h
MLLFYVNSSIYIEVKNMEEEKLSRADTKRLFIQELERYLLRISQKGDRLRKSSTKFSVARYSGLGSKIKLYLSNEQIYVRVFTSGEINISYYDTFYGTETRKEISPKFTDGTYTENEVKLMIKETKKFIRESLR